MKTLYVSQQGCYIKLDQETLKVEKKRELLAEIQLPLLEQVLIFGKSQMTTQAIRACLWRNIPVVYLSRMGYCYGRIMSVERGYRHLTRYQQELDFSQRLLTARQFIQAKLKNCRVILQRQQRKKQSDKIVLAIQSLDYLIQQAGNADTIERLMGFEGAGAGSYFSAFEDCLKPDEFIFMARSRRPPGNPVNALLSFGYQVLWNHLLALIEVQGLDPYQACLHQGSERHAALASDLIEEFRAPMVDSLVLYLINRRIMNADDDFEYHDGGCYLNNTGRKKYLKSFVQRMEEEVQTTPDEKQPRWDLLMQQVKRFKVFVYSPAYGYQPYLIR